MDIQELHFSTDKINELKKFYSRVLELTVLETENTGFKIEIGSTTLRFTKEKNTTSYYHFAVNIPQNQINEAIKWLKPKVSLIEVDGSPLVDFPNWNAHSVYFYDPAGNIVELIARHDLDNASAEPFSQNSFLNISEVGMPVEEVKAFHDIINTNFGEKLWSGNLETFAAIGDQNGLLIVVTTERNWYPTNKPCNIYPLSIKLRDNNSAPAVLEYSSYKIISE